MGNRRKGHAEMNKEKYKRVETLAEAFVHDAGITLSRRNMLLLRETLWTMYKCGRGDLGNEVTEILFAKLGPDSSSPISSEDFTILNATFAAWIEGDKQ